MCGWVKQILCQSTRQGSSRLGLDWSLNKTATPVLAKTTKGTMKFTIERVTLMKLLNRHGRKESERFKSFTYEELAKRDKVNLDIFWLKDDALEESANLPEPGIIAQEITDDLEAAQEQFATIAEDLKR